MSSDDLLIAGGQVLDGAGSPAQPSDILVSGGRIEAVGRRGGFPVGDRRVIDAHGLVVAPGFIDVHSHADNSPLLPYHDSSKILQGVTTEVVGNCGLSLAPLNPENSDYEASLFQLFPPVCVSWSRFEGLFDILDDLGYVTNYCPLVGHNMLRLFTCGGSKITPGLEDVQAMRRLLHEALEAGSFGLSSGLIYPPACFSARDELIALTRVLSPHQVYATHMRSEGVGLSSAIDEAVAVSGAAGCRLQISHLKAVGRRNWGGVAKALERLDGARNAGHQIRHDAYPYDASSTSLTSVLPPPYLAGGPSATLELLQRPGAADELARALSGDHPGWDNRIESAGWDGVVIAGSETGRSDGYSLGELARTRNIPANQALVDVLVEEGLRVAATVFWMHPEDVDTALEHPLTMIASDGLPLGNPGKPHPRLCGTFPRVLGTHVRARGRLALEDAVRKMTGLPAEWFNIPDRGFIRGGMYADLVAFDAATVADGATYEHPTESPQGIAWVMQAGQVVVEAGRYLGRRCGVRLQPRS